MTYFVEVLTKETTRTHISSNVYLYCGNSDARAKEALQNAVDAVKMSGGTCTINYKNADSMGMYNFTNGVDAQLQIENVMISWDGKNPAQRAAWLADARVSDRSMLYVWITKRFNELPRKMREALIASKSEAGVL